MGPNHGVEPLGSILSPIGAKKWGPIVINHNHPWSIFDSKVPPLGQKCKIFDTKVMGPNHGGEPLGSILGPIGAKNGVPP